MLQQSVIDIHRARLQATTDVIGLPQRHTGAILMTGGWAQGGLFAKIQLLCKLIYENTMQNSPL